MKSKGKRYTEEFKREAVRLISTSGLSVQKVASDLGISNTALGRWAKQYAIDNGSCEGLTTAEREELRRLRREVKTLRTEREILKKATAFFAKHGK